MKRAATAEISDHRKTRRKRESEINRGLRDLDEAGALAALDQVCDRWQLGEAGRALSFEEQTMRMFQQFGVEYRDNMLDVLDVDRGSFGLRDIDDRINDAELQAIGLYHRLHELGLLPENARGGGGGGGDSEDAAAAGGEEPAPGDAEDAEKRAHLRHIVKVLEMVFYAKRVVLSAFQAKLAVHQLHLGDGTLDLSADLDARLGSWALRFRYIENKTTPMQNLLLYLLDGAMEKRYRKSGGWMYEPVYIDGKNTHAWRPVKEIKDFVYGMLHKETCWEQWCNATSSGMKNIAGAIEYLSNCQDYQLPELHKQRGVYSFRNGVYMAEEDRFYEFGDGMPLSDDVVACKFVDDDFVVYEGRTWKDIPTPYLQSIMDFQVFPDDVCMWLYVMLGRLLYPLNERDGWQVIPFFKGQASSGKCFAAGTRIMMHDGSTRAVEDVVVGDMLMGDDGTPRTVLTLARGDDDLFDLVPRRKGYGTHTVTPEHVLCLKHVDMGEDVCEMTVAEYMALPESHRRTLEAYRADIGGQLKRFTLPIRYGFDVVPAARQPYFGFETDGNHRFLLGDFTVTHNSTIILKVCKTFYDAQDVGVLSNNIERKFGLSAFYDKYLFLAPEIKSDLGIEQAEFQSVVSGEDLQVNVKHKKAFATTWRVPGALAGNEVPGWADNSGSVQRRVLLWEFVRAVTNGDMKLGEKLLGELPAILAKVNKAYLEMSGRYGHVNVWTVLPQYFKETRDQLAQSVNSVEAFLVSTEVMHGEELYCPMEDFRAALKTFEVSNNYRSKKYDTDFFRGPFSKFNVRIERCKRVYRGANKTRDYVMGLDINMANPDDNELG